MSVSGNPRVENVEVYISRQIAHRSDQDHLQHVRELAPRAVR